MAQKDLKVTLIGEDRSGKAFASARRNADRFGGSIGKLGTGLALAFGGAVVGGIAGIGAAMVSGVKDAASYQQITDQLTQTLKSTGNAAGTSVGALKEYAGQLESISGVDEELILSSQNVLATFTRIKNGVGEGNDIFNQASEAALNLSTTMGGDLQGATVMLGKALNDPVKGITALGRAGVQLTAEQKEQIKTLVANGDAMGAQKIILGELETQFGGAAAAAGQGLNGSIARLKDTFQDTFRTLAENVLPTIERFVTGAANAMPGIIDRIKAGFDAAKPTLEAIGTALMTVGGFIRDNFMPILAAVGTVVTAALGTAFAGAVASVVAFLSPAVLVVAALAALAAGLVYAWRESDTFRDVVTRAFDAVKTAVAAAIDFIRSTVVPGISAMVAGSRPFLNDLLAAFRNVFEVIKGAVTVFIAVVQGAWNAFGQTLLSFIRAAFDNIKQVISGALDIIKGIVNVFVGVLSGDWRRAWDGIKSIVSGAWDVIKGVLGAAFAAVKGIFSLGLDALQLAWSAAWTAIKAVMAAAWEALKAAVAAGISAVVEFFRGLPGKAVAALASLGSSITGVARAAWTAFDGAVDAGIATVIAAIRGVPGKAVSALGDLGGLLVGAGRRLMEGLARGIQEKIDAVVSKVREAAQKIRDLLPGSPIKDGPLVGWNNGGAGKRLMDMLAGGIESRQGRVRSALVDALDVGGMAVGGTGFVNSRLTSTAGRAPVETASGLAGGDRTDELIALLVEQNELLRRMPREQQLLARTGGV